MAEKAKRSIGQCRRAVQAAEVPAAMRHGITGESPSGADSCGVWRLAFISQGHSDKKEISNSGKIRSRIFTFTQLNLLDKLIIVQM